MEEDNKKELKERRKKFKAMYCILSKRRENIYKEDKYKCSYCGIEVIDTRKFFNMIDEIGFEKDARKKIENCELYKTRMATLDHIIPLKKGGTNDRSNLTTCCIKCNLKKSIN